MPPGAVVAFRVILAPDINVMTYLLTYLLDDDDGSGGDDMMMIMTSMTVTAVIMTMSLFSVLM